LAAPVAMDQLPRPGGRAGEVSRRLGVYTSSGGVSLVKQVRIDWAKWLVLIERKRRVLVRLNRRKPSMDYLLRYVAQATLSSLRLEKIIVQPAQIEEALSHASGRRPVRSRMAQRIRNHAAILLCVESLVRNAKTLTSRMVVRWYTSISSGLSTTALDDSSINRLESVVRRINSPQLRLQAALSEVARLHVQLLSDPFVPSFNGILARLLLQCHIGRCGLPAVVLDSQMDTKIFESENGMLNAILHAVDASFDRMAAGEG
jgi:hypothetical protein